MAKRKDLKSIVSDTCADLVAEVVAVSLYDGKANHDNVLSIISSILKVRNVYVKRISHPEPGMEPKEYFKKITEDFVKEVDEIADQICNLHA